MGLFLLCCGLFLALIPCAQAADAYVFKKQWGSSGSGIAIDRFGNLYIADFMGNLVQKVPADGTPGIPWSLGTYQFTGPRGIAVDAGGNVFVTDYMANRVQKYTPEGILMTEWGTKGSGDGQFSQPRGIAVDAAGNVWVADEGNNRVQEFTAEGIFMTKWPVYAWKDHAPRAIAVDRNSNIYVTNYFWKQVQKYANIGNGTYELIWASNGEEGNPVSAPEGIAVDNDGFIYVVDSNNSRVQKMSPDGAFITAWGGPGDGPGQFRYPAGIAVDKEGNVYVADHGNRRIQVFAPVPVQVTPAMPPRPDIRPGFDAAPVRGIAPLTVRFNDTSTSAPVVISGWSWDFGDGTASSLKSPSHTFTAAGNYTVSLNVSTPGGAGSVTKTGIISVSAPAAPAIMPLETTIPAATNPVPKPTPAPLCPLIAGAGIVFGCLLHPGKK